MGATKKMCGFFRLIFILPKLILKNCEFLPDNMKNIYSQEILEYYIVCHFPEKMNSSRELFVSFKIKIWQNESLRKPHFFRTG